MVRPKLQLERLNGEISRDHYYLHNREIVSNKVKEMSVLTASDVLFLSFSPDGLPSLHLGNYSNLTDMVTRFAHISYHDREKRRLDNLQTLRSNYQKDEYNIDVNMLFQAWKVKRLEDMKQELNDLYEELVRLKKRKCFWENPKMVEDIEAIKEMEERLEKSLEGVHQRKFELTTNQMMRIPENPTPIEAFGCYTPEMLSGNDDMLGYAKMLMLSSGGPSAMNQHQ